MTTLAPTLTTRYFSRIDERLRDAMLVVGGSLLVALFAQIKVPLPFTPVPLTGQTFAVLLVGAALGSRRGPASMLLYLAEGALGLPFFAGGASGLAYMSGATLGYLVGFVVAAYVTGLLAEGGLDRRFRTAWIAILAGQLAIYIFGIAWLTIFLESFSGALMGGLVPFLIGDAIKLVLAGLALPGAWRLVQRQ